MKKLLLIVLVCIISTSLVNYVKQIKVIEKNAQEIADAFADSDMTAINKTIFGINEFEVDEEFSDMWKETINSQKGVLECIFEYVTVKVKKTTNSTIEYEIKAPDMENVFVDITANATDISEDELLQYIKGYAKNAEIKTATVSLQYTIVHN